MLKSTTNKPAIASYASAQTNDLTSNPSNPSQTPTPSPEHIGYGVIADIVADPEPALEELHCQVLGAAVVEQDAALGLGQHHQGDVGRGQGLQRGKLQVRVVTSEAETGQVLTVFAWGEGGSVICEGVNRIEDIAFTMRCL